MATRLLCMESTQTAETVTGACLHAELKIWLSPAGQVRLQARSDFRDPGRCKGNLIPLSLICKFSNEITLSKDGVYCHLCFDVQQADYVHVESRSYDNFLHKTAWKYRDNYGRNILQTRYSPSVTPIIKTQYGPHSSQIESWKMIEFLYAEVESKIGRWRYLMYIERDRL